MTKCQKYLTYAIFFNSWWFKDVKNDNPNCSDPRSESILIRSGTQEYRYTVEDRLLHCPHRFIQFWFNMYWVSSVLKDCLFGVGCLQLVAELSQIALYPGCIGFRFYSIFSSFFSFLPHTSSSDWLPLPTPFLLACYKYRHKICNKPVRTVQKSVFNCISVFLCPGSNQSRFGSAEYHFWHPWTTSCSKI